MRHGWIDPRAGFPAGIEVAGWPAGSTRAETFVDLCRVAAGARAGREKVKVWGTRLDALWFDAIDSGLRPVCDFRPGVGVSRIELAPGVYACDASPQLPPDVIELMRGASPAEMCGALKTAHDSIARGLGVSADAGIGAATTDALFGPWRLRFQTWDARTYTPEDAQLSRDAYHGGMVWLWHSGQVRTADAPAAIDADPAWADEAPSKLAPGYRIVDVDRASAYAADAIRPMPDMLGPITRDPAALMDAKGGAIVEARVDLARFEGIGFPVRVKVGTGITRQVPARGGEWRGVWTSELLMWASARGARVEVLGGIGWGRSMPYLGPIMDRMFTLKERATPGSIDRSIWRAAIQRCVGRLGRRPLTTVTLCGEDAARETADVAGWSARWRRVIGAGHGYFIAEPMEQPTEEPRGNIPPWPAFVVSRAWIRLCDEIERLSAAGAWPIYCDTDGVCVIAPPGVDLPAGKGVGDFRAKDEWAAVEHRNTRRWIRHGAAGTSTQWAGVAKSEQRAAFEGAHVVTRKSSALEFLTREMLRVPDRLTPTLAATADGVRRAKLYGRRAAQAPEEF